MENGIHLVIEKGEPHDGNTIIQITKNEYLLGRPWGSHAPDIAFTNFYISRKHALISRQNNQFQIVDLMSKHGTEVNGAAVTKNPYYLRDGDRISLAKGAVEMLFRNAEESDWEHTKEFVLPLKLEEKTSPGLVIHPERREICIDGAPLYLSSKDIDLLMLLHERVNQAVSYDEIKIHIWPERSSSTAGDIPDVGRDEINALVYRLRKRLGQYGQHIITIARYGYMLDL